jgi:hypothetical protein
MQRMFACVVMARTYVGSTKSRPNEFCDCDG